MERYRDRKICHFLLTHLKFLGWMASMVWCYTILTWVGFVFFWGGGGCQYCLFVLFCVAQWHLVSVMTFCVMYDHIFYKQVQISRSDIRPHIKWAVSLVILHMVTSISLWGLCGGLPITVVIVSATMKLDQNLKHQASQFKVCHVVYVYDKGCDVYFRHEVLKIAACSKIP